MKRARKTFFEWLTGNKARPWVPALSCYSQADVMEAFEAGWTAAKEHAQVTE